MIVLTACMIVLLAVKDGVKWLDYLFGMASGVVLAYWAARWYLRNE